MVHDFKMLARTRMALKGDRKEESRKGKAGQAEYYFSEIIRIRLLKRLRIRDNHVSS